MHALKWRARAATRKARRINLQQNSVVCVQVSAAASYSEVDFVFHVKVKQKNQRINPPPPSEN